MDESLSQVEPETKVGRTKGAGCLTAFAQPPIPKQMQFISTQPAHGWDRVDETVRYQGQSNRRPVSDNSKWQEVTKRLIGFRSNCRCMPEQYALE